MKENYYDIKIDNILNKYIDIYGIKFIEDKLINTDDDKEGELVKLQILSNIYSLLIESNPIATDDILKRVEHFNILRKKADTIFNKKINTIKSNILNNKNL